MPFAPLIVNCVKDRQGAAAWSLALAQRVGGRPPRHASLLMMKKYADRTSR